MSPSHSLSLGPLWVWALGLCPGRPGSGMGLPSTKWRRKEEKKRRKERENKVIKRREKVKKRKEI